MGERFTGDALDRDVLTTALGEAHAGIANLRHASPDAQLPSPQLYCVVLKVRGVPPGCYRYEPDDKALTCIRKGSWGLQLQSAQRSDNINVDQCSFVIHIVDQLDLRDSPRMNRAYRVQQMFAGAALDAVMLASSMLGVVSHPVLGFRAPDVDRLYEIADSPRGTLAQICVGVARRGGYLEGSIAS
jgi:SagB-type dehydrogenase family enzyme